MPRDMPSVLILNKLTQKQHNNHSETLLIMILRASWKDNLDVKQFIIFVLAIDL